MTKITENELKNKVSRLREYLTIVEAGYVAPGTAPGMGQKGPTVAAAQGKDPSNPLNKTAAPATASTKPAPAAPAKPAAPGKPLVNFEKDFPKATAIELQTKLNAAGEKLTVDGKMGPATRAAMARHPEITSDPNAAPAVPAAPAGDAAKAPVGNVNAATAIPTGGLENPANQAAAPAAPAAMPGIAPQAQVPGSPTDVGSTPGAAHAGQGGTAPDELDAIKKNAGTPSASAAGGYGTGTNNPSVMPGIAPQAQVPGSPTDVGSTPGAAHAGQGGTDPAAAQSAKPAPAPAAPDNSNVATDDIPFDPTWGGTKAAPDTRTGMEKFLPNFMGGKSAPVAANQNATWNNAQQAAVSNAPATQSAKPAPAPAPAPAQGVVKGLTDRNGNPVLSGGGGAGPRGRNSGNVGESTTFQNDELSRIVSLVRHR